MNFFQWRFAQDSEADVPVDKCRAKGGPDNCSVHGPMLREQDNVDRLEKDEPDAAALDAEYMDAVKNGDMDKCAKMVRVAFRRAVPNSKVIDEDGLPKTVYHGSENSFNVFDKNRIGENTDSGLWGRGFYFSSNEEEAKTYDRRNGTARPFYLDIENPCPNEEIKRAARDAAQKAENKYTDEMSPSEMKHIFDSLYHKGVEKLMKKNKYDGVIPGGRFNKEHVAIEPTQIKSADPVTYDDNGSVIPLSKRFQMDNPDIRY